MKHFIVINDWANKFESDVAILGVFHSMEEAQEIFDASVSDEKQYANEHGLTIYDDCATAFDAGEDGYYVSNHTRLYILQV